MNSKEEKEAIVFTNKKLKPVSTLLSNDYKIGYKEGVQHYLKSLNNYEDITLKAYALVEELNDELYDKGGLDYYIPFEFKSSGYQNSAIYFMGIPIWTDDNDEREYIFNTNIKEPLKVYILRESKKILKDLKLKMKSLKNI